MHRIHTKYLIALTVAAISTFAVTMPSFAQTNTPPAPPSDGASWHNDQHKMPSGMQPGIFGTVTAVNGSTLTVSGRGFGSNSASTTYTVDASGATVLKNNATSTLSSILLNDRVFVQGTVNGTSVTATSIRDGVPMMRGRGSGMMHPDMGANGGIPGQPQISGNGQPVVAGTVSSINGTTVNITTSSNTSYTIDASSTKVTKGNSTSSVTNILTGDFIVVQGNVNGSSVTAASIIDQASVGTKGGNGFFGSIGSFFKHLFGF